MLSAWGALLWGDRTANGALRDDDRGERRDVVVMGLSDAGACVAPVRGAVARARRTRLTRLARAQAKRRW